MVEVEAIVAEELYAGGRGRLAENFLLVDKICKFLRIVHSLPIFSLGCTKHRGVMAKFASLVPFRSALIVNKVSVICLSIC